MLDTTKMRLKGFSVLVVLVVLAAFAFPLSGGLAQTGEGGEDIVTIPGYSVALLIEGLNMPAAVAVSDEMIWVAEAAFGGEGPDDAVPPVNIREMDRHGDDDEVRTILTSSELSPGTLVVPVTDMEYEDGWLWITHRTLETEEQYYRTGVSRFRPENPAATFETVAAMQDAVGPASFYAGLAGGVADMKTDGDLVFLLQAGTPDTQDEGILPQTGSLLLLFPEETGAAELPPVKRVLPKVTPPKTATSTPGAVPGENTPAPVTPKGTASHWRENPAIWTGYSPETTLGSVFSLPPAFSEIADDTFLEALGYAMGTTMLDWARLVLHNAVVALLNAAHPGINYPISQGAIINEVNNALVSAGGAVEGSRAVWLGQGVVNDVYQAVGASMASTVIFSLYLDTRLFPENVPFPQVPVKASGWFAFSFDGRVVVGWFTQGSTNYMFEPSPPKKAWADGRAFYLGRLYDCAFHIQQWPPGGGQSFSVTSAVFPAAPEISLWSSHSPGLAVNCLVEGLNASTITQITASPAETDAGGSVELTVTEQNDGDLIMRDVRVAVTNGTSEIALLTGPPDSGDDDSDNAFSPGETWQWQLDSGPLTENTTFTATGSGMDPEGNVITYPGDPDEQSSVEVMVTDNITEVPTLEGIVIAPDPGLLEAGGTLQFTAAGTYSDNTTEDITGEVSWTSSDESVVTIGSSGLASGVEEGNAEITASLSDVTETVAVTVTATAQPPDSGTPEAPSDNTTPEESVPTEDAVTEEETPSGDEAGPGEDTPLGDEAVEEVPET